MIVLNLENAFKEWESDSGARLMEFFNSTIEMEKQ